MSKVVDYYMTPVSPFTYLGHDRLRAICAQHAALIRLRVIDLGKIFPASGGVALKDRAPQRKAYRLMELARWRDFLRVPLNLEPKYFPVPPVPPPRPSWPLPTATAPKRRSISPATACARSGPKSATSPPRAHCTKSCTDADSTPGRYSPMRPAARSPPSMSSIRRRRSRVACSVRPPMPSATSCSGARTGSTSCNARSPSGHDSAADACRRFTGRPGCTCKQRERRCSRRSRRMTTACAAK